MSSTVINLLSEAYGLSKQQEEMLLQYSDAALEHAVKELYRQNKQSSLNAPVNWIAAVARNFQEKASHSKKGKALDDFQKKIVHGTFNHNHSPASEAPKVSDEERIAFLQSEIPKIKDLISQAENGRVMYGGPEYGRRMLANVQEELDILLGKKLNDPEYEDHLEEISRDKSNPEAYKDLVRRYDYRRIAR